jgi:thiosulfate dehydrogenase (quinone) large subunit
MLFMATNSTTSPSRFAANTTTSSRLTSTSWREKGIGVLRIVFGIIWAIDAWFKWQPDFQNNFVSYLTGALDGQPAPAHAWINFWIHVVQVNPHLFAQLAALGETAVAIGLIFGIFSNVTMIGGFFLSLMIWSTAEGFGGPYLPGSTDIGTAIIYAIAFVGLFLASSGLYLGIDRWLTPRLGRLSILASGRSHSHKVS